MKQTKPPQLNKYSKPVSTFKNGNNPKYETINAVSRNASNGLSSSYRNIPTKSPTVNNGVSTTSIKHSDKENAMNSLKRRFVKEDSGERNGANLGGFTEGQRILAQDSSAQQLRMMKHPTPTISNECSPL